MDGELLRSIYHRLFESDSARPHGGQLYGDAVVALFHCFAVLSGRSHLWAYDKGHCTGRCGCGGWRSRVTRS